MESHFLTWRRCNELLEEFGLFCWQTLQSIWAVMRSMNERNERLQLSPRSRFYGKERAQHILSNFWCGCPTVVLDCELLVWCMMDYLYQRIGKVVEGVCEEWQRFCGFWWRSFLRSLSWIAEELCIEYNECSALWHQMVLKFFQICYGKYIQVQLSYFALRDFLTFRTRHGLCSRWR